MNVNKNELHLAMLSFIFKKKAILKIYFVRTWKEFQKEYSELFGPDSNIDPVELILEFYTKVLKNVHRYSFETNLEYKYFTNIYCHEVAKMLYAEKNEYMDHQQQQKVKYHLYCT